MRSFLFVLLCTTLTFAAPNATALVKKADLLIRGEKSSEQHVSFSVIRANKKVDRTMMVYLKGKNYSFTHILKPIKDKNTVILKRNSDMWMYTPAVRKEIKIPVSMMHESVLGSDFTYDDIMRESTFTDDYSHKLVGKSPSMEKTHGTVYIIDLAPLPGRAVAYKKLRMWIRTSDGNMLRVQYYNDDLKVQRILSLEDIASVGDRSIPTKWTMVDNSVKGNMTVYRILGARYNKMENEDIFNKRSILSPPNPTLDTQAEKLPDATALVKKADLLIRGEKSSNQYVNFEVRRSGKDPVKRKMGVYLKGRDYSFTHVLAPIKDRDITILKRHQDMWTYTPKIRKQIRIPVAQMHESVLGSDFTYDDIMRESTFTDDYSHKIIGTSKAFAKKYGTVYVLELTPLPGRAIAYRQLRMWIRELDGNMVRVQYYNDDLQVTRIMDLTDIREVGGRSIPTKWVMFDVQKKGNYTLYNIQNAKYNEDMKDSTFEQRSLAEPPQAVWK
ncbi:outer membrane lipoprotein-sorting protein [Candidatus Uabimicrobium amorphum]|uniref:Outer membrane lipoprotein-sorting protein n=1 Tax=Uabimicrobium amorphum TaxID=2596890 RepID=A0A5S9IJP1_UABAM|nr:outer membrane lipoprotein-sorting protein [Candidatus Uabimicrobium amorphum]BBM82290.1 outer membrane lipoprotein-sorting protein [Candidatus Uabimicrobium amorphum]